MNATCKSGCGHGNRIIIRRGFLSITSRMPLVCCLAPGCMPFTRNAGAAFVEDYMQLLASTGEATAADLAARFRHRHPQESLLAG